MFASSEAGSYSRLVDFVYHPTLGWRAMKKKKKRHGELSYVRRIHSTGGYQRDRPPLRHVLRPPIMAWGDRGTSLIRNSAPVGAYRRTMARLLRRS